MFVPQRSRGERQFSGRFQKHQSGLHSCWVQQSVGKSLQRRAPSFMSPCQSAFLSKWAPTSFSHLLPTCDHCGSSTMPHYMLPDAAARLLLHAHEASPRDLAHALANTGGNLDNALWECAAHKSCSVSLLVGCCMHCSIVGTWLTITASKAPTQMGLAWS